jgi:hypothetical protein
MATFVAAAAFAQGTVSFKNGTGSQIKIDGANATIPVTVELWWGPAGSDAASLEAAVTGRTAMQTGGPFAGIFNGGDPFAIQGAAIGSTVAIEIRAWETGAGADFASAAANGGLVGMTGVRDFGLGGGTVLPTTLFPPFTSINLAIVPEPSTFALAGLGAAALLIFRRRN